MIQQVSYRPIKCQSRSWPSRVTAVSGSHKGESPLLKPTEIRHATIYMLGTTTNGETETYRRQDTLFGYGIRFVLWGCCNCFRITTYWKIVSGAAQPTKSSSIVQNYLLCRLRQSIRFFTTVLYAYRAGVRKRRCGEAVWRLPATVSPPYGIGLRERRRGENVYTRPSSPLDSQTVGSCK